jgi:hypothetical protein
MATCINGTHCSVLVELSTIMSSKVILGRGIQVETKIPQGNASSSSALKIAV